MTRVPRSAGGSADPVAIYAAKPAYAQPAPTGVNKLVYLVPPGSVPPPHRPTETLPPNFATVIAADAGTTFKHRIAQYPGGTNTSPVCPQTAPPPSFN